MPVNAMNVGVDYAFQYFSGQTGALVNLTDVQDVVITAQKHDIKTMPYNNVPRFGYVPDGFKVEFTITRSLPILEDLMASYSAAFNQGQVLGPGFLNESVNNADGSLSRYQYTNCVIYLINHGNISRDKVVVLRLEGYASDKVKIA